MAFENRRIYQSSPPHNSVSGYTTTDMQEALNITPIPLPPYLSVSPPASYDEHRGKHTPLVIDNGSTTLRFGFCTSSTPRCQPNAVAKYKERKTNKPLLLFGDGIDTESGARSQAKTPWEGDVLLNFDALVSIFYALRCSTAHQGSWGP